MHSQILVYTHAYVKVLQVKKFRLVQPNRNLPFEVLVLAWKTNSLRMQVNVDRQVAQIVVHGTN